MENYYIKYIKYKKKYIKYGGGETSLIEKLKSQDSFTHRFDNGNSIIIENGICKIKLNDTIFDLPPYEYFFNFDYFSNNDTIIPGYGGAFFKSYKTHFIAKIFVATERELDFDALILSLKEIALQHYANTNYPDKIMKINCWFIGYSEKLNKHFVGFIMNKMTSSIMTIDKVTKLYAYIDEEKPIYIKGICFLRECYDLLLKIGILHNDLHLGNVLLDDTKQMFLTDFGEATYILDIFDKDDKDIERNKNLSRIREVNYISLDGDKL
jgi:hypothetical protein